MAVDGETPVFGPPASINDGFGGSDVELAPLRTMEDFLTDSARFQGPDFKNLEKWSNRVIQNLIYYQTNYFILLLSVFLIVGLVHPSEMLTGFFAVLIAVIVFAFTASSHKDAVQFKKDHPLVSLGVITGAGYFLVSMLSSVIVLMFGIALPLLILFMHASMRLRNWKNKIAGKMEASGLKKTPMGKILSLVGLESDLIRLE